MAKHTSIIATSLPLTASAAIARNLEALGYGA
jgi:hypothetical protein